MENMTENPKCGAFVLNCILNKNARIFNIKLSYCKTLQFYITRLNETSYQNFDSTL